MITPEQEQQLIDAAKVGMQNAYTKTGSSDEFRVGCAVLTKTGNIYSSGQYFSWTQSLTLHSEQCVLAVAAASGEYDIIAIAVIANRTTSSAAEEQPVYPCHMCKQILYESSSRSKLDMEVIVVNSESKVVDRFLLSSVISKPWPIWD